MPRGDKHLHGGARAHTPDNRGGRPRTTIKVHLDKQTMAELEAYRLLLEKRWGTAVSIEAVANGLLRSAAATLERE